MYKADSHSAWRRQAIDIVSALHEDLCRADSSNDRTAGKNEPVKFVLRERERFINGEPFDANHSDSLLKAGPFSFARVSRVAPD
jgi:hypothetical protein